MRSSQREEVLNGELGRLLIEKHPYWNEGNVHIDSTRTIRGNAALKLDLLIEHPNGHPVAVETKFDLPGSGAAVRKQLKGRIGLAVDSSGLKIEGGVAVLYPNNATASGLGEAPLRYAALQLGSAGTISEWPQDEEWSQGSLIDIANAIELVSLSESRILRGSQVLSNGVKDASALLGVCPDKVAETLHQSPSNQTVKMSVSIIINAFIFHYAIEAEAGIPDVLNGSKGGVWSKRRVLSGWDQILEINYWPIFFIAKSVLRVLPARQASELLATANGVAEQLLAIGTTTLHDLSARMFQTLIADRKLLATFYTLPESATLLAELAVQRLAPPPHKLWSSRKRAESLKVADFACGTGALLSAAQQAMYRRMRRHGHDDGKSHRAFMEGVLLGTDIMPAAAHLTASMLSGAHPSIGYGDSLVRVLPYGTDEELSSQRGHPAETAYIGALDLRGRELGRSLFSGMEVSHGVKIGGTGMSSTGSRHDSGGDFPVEHESFDLVIMNPPFTRPTNHEAGKSDIPVPSFAGFGTSQDEQHAMSRKLKSLDKQFGHGNAGLASDFMDLAHDKVKPGGVLALVLPFSFVSGRSWSNARNALSRHYKDITVVSIAASKAADRAFSADTSMAECLVIATRERRQKLRKKTLVRYVNITRRPRTLLEAHEKAKDIENGSNSVVVAGFDTPGPAGLLNFDLLKVMTEMTKGRLKLPRMLGKGHDLPICKLSDLARRGLIHRDINGAAGRGSFDIVPIPKDHVPTYPALWSHDANKERRLVVKPDSHGQVRTGLDDRAARTWSTTSSRLHYNQDFGLNCQSTAACITKEPCIGGRAWPNVIPNDGEEYEIPLLLWLNTTLGLMAHWWFGSKQHPGRSMLTISSVPGLPVLDVRSLSKDQRKRIDRIFSAFEKQTFLPANESYRDPVRKALDQAILFGALDISQSLSEGLDLLRLQWCSEPSVHGGKHTRPTNA